MRLSKSGVRNWTRLSWVLAWTAAAVLHGWSLMRFPAPFVDEAWLANRAWALLHEGVAYGTLDAGVFEVFDGYWTYFPIVPSALHAVAILAFGGPSLLALRVETLAMGGVLIAACYRIGTHAAGRRIGALGALLVSVSPFFLLSAHLARGDIMTAAAGYWALALLLGNSRKRLLQSAFAGLLTGVAFEIHPLGGVFVLPSLGVFALQSGRAAALRPDAWAWGCGGVVGGAAYACLHVLRYPDTFVAIAALTHGPTHTPPIATLNAGVIATSALETLELLSSHWLWPGAWLIAIVWQLRRRVVGGETITSLTLCILAGFVLLVRSKFVYHGILVSPLLDLSLAVFLLNAPRHPFGPTSLARMLAMAAILVATSTSVAHLIVRQGPDPLVAALRAIAPRIRRPDVIIGSQIYWFGFQEHRYLSWEQIVYYRRLHPAATVEDALQHLRPDVLIVDDHVRRFIRDDPGGAYGGELNVSERGLNAALTNRAMQVAAVRVPTYGAITIYRFTWQDRHSDRTKGEVVGTD